MQLRLSICFKSNAPKAGKDKVSDVLLLIRIS